ncbi:MAG: UDP-N-acetylmuramoyl-L-alanine--D-glutamate ligase [Candidatus Poribacteria bacterium]|nr:UDP-N-acetylmuramoyl-L-alanine--D-glutamate ligase [Candidatus Poribacteria bacterium]MDE0505242.1 UDP-N-acetylmuramoyl-L-alanine--D-glutamate ligase [Candidatus Poribacteria bacterium]
MKPANFRGQRITVFGLHSSGVAVAKLLDDLGADVQVTDSKPANELQSEVQALKDRAIRFILGGHDNRCIESVDLMVVSPGVPLDIPVLKAARALSIPIIGELEVAASVCPAQMVAITGTKGKSTTTLLIAEILKQSRKFPLVCTSGNIGVPLSNNVQRLTEKDIVVLEASSFQLETTTLFQPAVSAVLNFTRDHLDRHKTVKAYRDAKLKVCANQSPTDWVVLNADDPVVANFSGHTAATPVYFTEDAATMRSGAYTSTKEAEEHLVVMGSENEILARQNGALNWICDVTDISMVGRHNVRNVLAATAVARILNVSCEQIRSAICQFSPKEHDALEHTLEPVGTVRGVRIVNDSKATNVDAVRAAIEAISDPLLLIMGGYDKGNDYTPLIDLVKSKVKALILLGKHTGRIRNALGSHVVTWDAMTMNRAVEVAYSHAVPGDVILLSPANASFDMFDDYKARGCAFREAAIKLETMGSMD